MAENGIANGGETAAAGGLGVVVGQIRAPSTPFNADMNPLSDFQFSGRNDVVTVNDVEGIVSAIKDSFSRFIETQRAYIDREKALSQSGLTESSDSTETTSQTTETVKNVESSSSPDDGKDLTRTEVSDIIEPISSEKAPLVERNEEVLNDIKTDFSDKIDDIGNNIAEKLLESKPEETVDKENATFSPSREGTADDMSMSFADFMSEVNSINDSISKKLSEKESEGTVVSPSIQEKEDVAPVAISDVNVESVPLRDVKRDEGTESEVSSTNDVSSDEILLKAGELLSSVESIANDISTVNVDSGDSATLPDFEEFKANQASFAEVVDSNRAALVEMMESGNRLSTAISGITEGGFARSMVDVMLQDSSFEAMLSGSVEGMGASLMERIGGEVSEIVDGLRTIDSAESDSVVETSSTPSEVIRMESEEVDAATKTALASEPVVVTVERPTNVESVETGETAPYRDMAVDTAKIAAEVADSVIPSLYVPKESAEEPEGIGAVETSETVVEMSPYRVEEVADEFGVVETSETVEKISPYRDMEGVDEFGVVANSTTESYDTLMSEIRSAIGANQGTSVAGEVVVVEPSVAASPSVETENGVETAFTTVDTVPQPPMSPKSDFSSREDVVETPTEQPQQTASGGNDMDSAVEGIREAIKSGVEYLGGRFDNLERAVAGTQSQGAQTSHSTTVVEQGDGAKFETERIY